MENEKVKKSNLCAQIGFLLTLLNLVVSVGFSIAGTTVWLLVFASVTAGLSLILCIYGKINSRKTGTGKVLSIIGIILNAMILTGIAVFIGGMIFFIESCKNIQISLHF